MLPAREARAVSTGVDVIGDIAVVKLDESVKSSGPVVGEAILSSMKNVKAVFDQIGGLEGDFRLRRLTHIAGEVRTLTMHRENGLRFLVDVEKCYFSPRLSTERLRVAESANEGELVLNMFAGVGPFSNTLSRKKRAIVYSNELNLVAFELHCRNNELNKVSGLTRMTQKDALELPSHYDVKFDRILMPHPSQSNRFLAAAWQMIRPGGWIHYYRHISARDFEEARSSLDKEVRDMVGDDASVTPRKVREIGPRYLELVADIRA